jgi:hypothetical protein
VPKRPKKPEWDPPVSISIEKDGAVHTGHYELRPVEIHRELMTAAARWMIAVKLESVLSARMAIRLNSLSLPKKFSIR